MTTYTTGVPLLDAAGALADGQLGVLAARVRSGKTLALMRIAAHLNSIGVPVLFYGPRPSSAFRTLVENDQFPAGTLFTSGEFEVEAVLEKLAQAERELGMAIPVLLLDAGPDRTLALHAQVLQGALVEWHPRAVWVTISLPRSRMVDIPFGLQHIATLIAVVSEAEIGPDGLPLLSYTITKSLNGPA